ncbi:hypothetical protein D9V37_05995 [Nocardioides mangrovicus]|uniref:Uncharacterized protein n=1 Tax=Nocardioides mangrovicus TaxID=2478913 RepID=A0A3L8P250_9ACTN|nr:hypothetical protein [Nocardioides mangrovicus]RLV49490.1 hypothetical protein D9V37_05995 [Nocardioides mangrovicus]
MSGTAPQDPVVEPGDVAQSPADTSDEPSVDPDDSPVEETPRFDVEQGDIEPEDETGDADPT